MENTKDLNYYKNNCEEDYINTPISVLRYITELEQNDVIRRLSIQEALNYEVHSHWLARWIGFELGQDLMGKYFAWKVRKKYNRYLVSLEERKRVLNGL